jgi:FkbM family methyltransferase
MPRMTAKSRLRELVRRLGLEFGPYWATYRARRQKLMGHHGVDLVVDVGGNDGRYGRELRRGGYRGRIVSFEPASGPFRSLETMAADDPRWDVRKVAVGDEPGDLTLHVSESDLFSSLLPMHDVTLKAAPHARYVRDERVAVERLDTLAADAPGRALLVKADVQGFEAQVFDGAPATLERAVMVEVELSPVPVYAGQELLVETVQRMERIGLTLALVENVFPDHGSGRAMQVNGLFARI